MSATFLRHNQMPSEKIKQQKREWYYRNRKAVLKQQKTSEKRKESKKEWYERNRKECIQNAINWTKDNPEKFEILKEIAIYNEKAFDKATSIVYNKQRKYAEEYIKPEHRIGCFTTLSANRYHAGQSAKMSAHIDSGDTEFGMTTMCVFRQGDYQGAYLTFPRYSIGIDAPDNSVLIADSREVHGVTSIRGNGERFSCVAYCDNRLATIGNAGKSERLIGKNANKEIGNLEEFI